MLHKNRYFKYKVQKLSFISFTVDLIRYDVKLVKKQSKYKNFISTIVLRKVRKHILNGIIMG